MASSEFSQIDNNHRKYSQHSTDEGPCAETTELASSDLGVGDSMGSWEGGWTLALCLVR